MVKPLTESAYAFVTDADQEIARDIKEMHTYGYFDSEADVDTTNDTAEQLGQQLAAAIQSNVPGDHCKTRAA